MKKIAATHLEMFRHMAEIISKHKRIHLHVMGTKKHKAFTYTVGNQERNLPELLIFAASEEDSSQILNELSDLMIENKRPFFHGEEVNMGGADNLIVYDCTNIAHVQYTTQAGQFYGNEDYKVQQVVFRDPNGRMPDDPLCHRDYRVPLLKKLEVH